MNHEDDPSVTLTQEACLTHCDTFVQAIDSSAFWCLSVFLKTMVYSYTAKSRDQRRMRTEACDELLYVHVRVIAMVDMMT